MSDVSRIIGGKAPPCSRYSTPLIELEFEIPYISRPSRIVSAAINGELVYFDNSFQ